MSTNKTAADHVIWEPRAEKIVKASSLFEAGDLSDADSNLSFILRLNTLVSRQDKGVEKNTPKDLAHAISESKVGELSKFGELVAFGDWLLLNGQPGMANQGGRQPNPQSILKCVAAAILELRRRKLLKNDKIDLVWPGCKKSKISARHLAARWNKLFKEEEKHTTFDARLRSMRRILSAYLEHLKSGKAIHAGKQIKTSPEIKKVLKAVSSGIASKTANNIPALKAPITPMAVTLVPFEIELRYSATDLEREYRNRPIGSMQPSQLQYLPTATSPTSMSGNIRPDRKGKVALVPNVKIRGSYKVNALIDRIVILVDINIATSARSLHDKIYKATKANTFVCDLKLDRNKHEWGAPLPKLDPTKMVGQSFAIMIQDPSPDVLIEILKLIYKDHRIVGSIGIHLIEVSVDFYPHSPKTPEESILLREQMVGLLQRHHWVAPSLLLRHNPHRQRDVDARQFYGKENLPRYLFAEKGGGKPNSDCMIEQADVMKRILTTKPGNDLFLNSTLVKGAKSSEFMVSIQHKIADRRDPKKETMEILPDNERRARIEVTISDSSTLKKLGLDTINDLATVAFRSLCKDTLSFKLGTIEPEQHFLEDAQIQMKTRGVYGMELRHRARAKQERNDLRRAGQKVPRKPNRANVGLDDWSEMNQVVRHALDEMSRRWGKLSFT